MIFSRRSGPLRNDFGFFPLPFARLLGSVILVSAVNERNQPEAQADPVMPGPAPSATGATRDDKTAKIAAVDCMFVYTLERRLSSHASPRAAVRLVRRAGLACYSIKRTIE
jgi:hypothetical protein